MRPAERGPIPDLDVVLRETNRLLAANGFAECESIVPAEDQDTGAPCYDAPRVEVG